MSYCKNLFKWILSTNNPNQKKNNSHNEKNVNKPTQNMKTNKTYEP